MPCPLSPGLKLLRKTDISLTTLACGGKIFLLFPSEGQSSHNAEHLEHAHTRSHTHGIEVSLQRGCGWMLGQAGACCTRVGGLGTKRLRLTCLQLEVFLVWSMGNAWRVRSLCRCALLAGWRVHVCHGCCLPSLLRCLSVLGERPSPAPSCPPAPLLLAAHWLSLTVPRCGSSGSLNLGLKIGLESRWPEVRNQPAAH